MKDLKTIPLNKAKSRILTRCRWFPYMCLIINIVIVFFVVKIMIISGGHILTYASNFFRTQEEIIMIANDPPVTAVQKPIPTMPENPRPQKPTPKMSLKDRLRSIIKCYDRSFEPKITQRGEYWVLKNYIRAEHGNLGCYESLTYTTHADYSFLENLLPILNHFRAPVSVAIHAPGTDFQRTLEAISYLRECELDSNLVRMYATFHLYFLGIHTPEFIPHHSKAVKTPYNCSLPAPYRNVSAKDMYKTKKNVFYPINVGRNIARDAALTHFILPSDIELYPVPGLEKMFLEMIARNESNYYRPLPHVYVLPVFEVVEHIFVPRTKTELKDLLRHDLAIPFHKYMCPACHTIPKQKEWIADNQTEKLSVFHIAKRLGEFRSWEPFFIGTHDDPYYDNRLYWEGNHDKMPQSFEMCALDYEFFILNNAFLVHKPGIKRAKNKSKLLKEMSPITRELISNIMFPELQKIYGKREGCTIFA